MVCLKRAPQRPTLPEVISCNAIARDPTCGGRIQGVDTSVRKSRTRALGPWQSGIRRRERQDCFYYTVGISLPTL